MKFVAHFLDIRSNVPGLAASRGYGFLAGRHYEVRQISVGVSK